MAEEIKPECLKKTQESLGKFIKKPILTDRLLSKPPFRFLHDICTAAMKETGFFEGIFNSNDCKVENIKDKDGKIQFLQKVIAAVEDANGIKLAVKPNKVVAGYEPVRTNEFLQALGAALEKKEANRMQETNATKSSQPTTKTKTKTAKHLEKEETTQNKKTSSTRQSKNEKSSERKIKEEGKSKSKTEKILSSSEQKTTKKSNISPKEQAIKQDTHEEKRPKHKDQPKLKNFEFSTNVPTETSAEAQQNRIDEKPVQSNHQIVNAEQEELNTTRPQTAKSEHNIQEISSVEPPGSKDNESEATGKSEVVTSDGASDSPLKRPESSLLKMNKIQSGSPMHYQLKDSEVKENSPPVSRPRTGMISAAARPMSARPAAPRIRDRGEISVHEDVVKPATGNVEIITDKKEENEPEEDENVVVVETETELLVGGWEGRADQLNSGNDQGIIQGEHGLLVEQILETQKELDQSRLQVVDNKSAGKPEIEWKSGRNRESTNREVNKMRQCIQTLTRSVNPLGKLLDFLQEDVDIMQKELMSWKEMNSNLEMQIAQERTLTEQSIEPLKVHLKDVQQIIDEQLEQMNVVKANILRNDEKILKLLIEIN